MNPNAYARAPEIEVASLRAAMCWAGEHDREVLLVCASEAIAQRCKQLIAERLGRRARLVRVEVRSE